MKKNKGHARCNAFGIRYIFENEKFDYLILMDGDGEDRPIRNKRFNKKIKKTQTNQLLQKELKDLRVYFSKFYINCIKLLTFYLLEKKLILEIIVV